MGAVSPVPGGICRSPGWFLLGTGQAAPIFRCGPPWPQCGAERVVRIRSPINWPGRNYSPAAATAVAALADSAWIHC